MLLKCLMGFYKPNFGEIQKKDKLKIGYMPQSINIINTMPMTVKNFITVRKKYDDISFKQVVSEIDIRQLVDKQLSVLSGGEMQRVLLARSLLNNPDLLVLDANMMAVYQHTNHTSQIDNHLIDGEIK